MSLIETERLTLRPLTAADAPFILALFNDPDFLQHIGDRGVRTLDDARHTIEQGPVASYGRFGYGLYLTARKADGAAIGICGLVRRDGLDDPDVGFAFLPRFRGQGYAYEAAAAVMEYGRSTLGLPRIVAIVSPENGRSIKLLQKLGLHFQRMIRLAADKPEVMLFAPAAAPSP